MPGSSGIRRAGSILPRRPSRKRYSRVSGEEFGEHQRRGRIAARLLEGSAGAVERPVVAARVEAPDLFRFGENEQTLRIRRPTVILDLEWLAVFWASVVERR